MTLFFNRTFHPDEANQAFTTGKLLETGHYAYKPTDHHGPTLYYAAAPLQKAFGHGDTASLDGNVLRCTPLVFAVLAIVLAFLAVRKATKSALSATFAAALLAAAPIFMFYATDFIQEMLLVSFSVAMLWSAVGYFHSLAPQPSPGNRRFKPGTWALFFGISAGLAFATKETSVLTFAAAALAGWCARPKRPHTQDDYKNLAHDGQAQANRKPPVRNRPESAALQAALLSVFAFILTAVLLFSAFCEDWGGVYNVFIAAPLSYFHRAAGDAAGGANWHVHPWWWYAKILFFPKCIIYSLVFIPLIVYPLLFRFRQSRLLLFLALHSLVLFALYSIIPYKTPWCMLQVAVPLILAYGTLLGEIASKLRHGITIAATAFTMPLVIFAFTDAYTWCDPDSREIPYNYAHASPQVKDLAACVASAIHRGYSSAQNTSKNQKPETRNQKPETPAFVAVALPACDTWPFPWYNRALEHITGYWTDFSSLETLAKNGIKPTVVVCPAEDGHKVMPLFPHLNRTRRFEMRPRVRIRAFWSEP